MATVPADTNVGIDRSLLPPTNKPLNEKKITAEVCVPHLYFSGDDYATKGTLIKCNPSVKSISDKTQ